MGKARILNHQGDAYYTIELLEDRTRTDERRALAEQRIVEVDDEITSLQTDLNDAQSLVDAAADERDSAINDYRLNQTEENRRLMAEKGKLLVEATVERDVVVSKIRALKVERLGLEKTIALIDALPPLRQQPAWCADYTETLTGEVATAEVPGEVGRVIIQPGFSDGAAWSGPADGAIQPALAGTPASVFYNLSMLPGWQKWRPTFRTATISNISIDLCDIALDPETSSQQNLDVNAQANYTSVPIMYMDCNGGVFKNGDKVLVAFSGNTEAPMVVGFESNPRACSFALGFPVRLGSFSSQAGESGFVPCFPVAPAGWWPRSTGWTSITVDGTGVRRYYGLTQEALDAAATYEEVDAVYGGLITTSFSMTPTRVALPRYVTDYFDWDGNVCTPDTFFFTLAKVPQGTAPFELVGIQMSSSSTSTSASTTLEAYESNDAAFYDITAGLYDYAYTNNIPSISYLCSPDLSPTPAYTETLNFALADFPDVEHNGDTYVPESIMAVKESGSYDNRSEDIDGTFMTLSRVAYIVVKYVLPGAP